MHKIREVHTKATLLLAALSLGPLATAWAQTPNPSAGPTAGPTGASTVLPAVTVTAPAELERQWTGAASEQKFSGETLNTRPISRPAEILEATPGLIVTQHSGEGKANQYFLRG